MSHNYYSALKATKPLSRMSLRKIIAFIIIALLFAVGMFSYPVQAHWDNDVWLAREREGLSDWDSLLELKCFLALDSGAVTIKVDSTGTVSFDGQCEDFAFSLRDRAEAWGRRLEVEILTPYEMNKYYQKGGKYHAINKAVIGNEWWYVDKKEDKLWNPINLD